MRLASSLCLLLACSGVSVSAQVPVEPPGPLPEIRDLESNVVSGVQPVQAALGAELVRKHGPTAIEATTRAAWLEAAELAIGRNRVAFATLPISDLLKDEGPLASFTARGYLIEAP